MKSDKVVQDLTASLTLNKSITQELMIGFDQSLVGKYYRSLKVEGINNPFLDNRFYIFGPNDTFGEYSTLHIDGPVSIKFDTVNFTQTISFAKEESIWGSFIAFAWIGHPWYSDDNWVMTINGIRQRVLEGASHVPWAYEDSLVFLHKMLVEEVLRQGCACNDFVISFSDKRKHLFWSNQQRIIYHVDGDHDDDYYYNIEVNKRLESITKK